MATCDNRLKAPVTSFGRTGRTWRVGAFAVVMALSCMLMMPSAGAYNRQVMTDGGYADGFWGDWGLAPGYGSPANGFALTHLYFNFAQAPGQRMNLLRDNAAFAEFGPTVGALDNTSYTGIQFFWQSCQSSSSPATCDLRTDYFETYMAPTPTLVVGHVYRYHTVIGYHDGSYWWDMYISDLTIAGPYIRGGGRASGSYGTTCCSTAAAWGAEAEDRTQFGDPSLVAVPATLGELAYHSSAWYWWGRSSLWGAGEPANSVGCRVDDSVTDGDCDGLTPGVEFTHRWDYKYHRAVVKSSDQPG